MSLYKRLVSVLWLSVSSNGLLAVKYKFLVINDIKLISKSVKLIRGNVIDIGILG